MSSLYRIAGLVAPPRCLCCSAACRAGHRLCDLCLTKLLDQRPVVTSGPAGVELTVAPGPHADLIRTLVHALKYARCIPAADVAAGLIVAATPASELRGTLVPVPPSPGRLRWRGFDPAEEIAIALWRRRDLGLAYSSCLARDRGPRQVGRTRGERLIDPPQVRVLRGPPARALIVDDVWTTGATLSACAAALRAAGAREVLALTLASA